MTFAPFDCCALLYRESARAQAVHAQHEGYLRFLDEWGDWNPSDFAIYLTRRARGLAFWFSLATHGTDAYADAIQVTLVLAQAASRRIDAVDHIELARTSPLEPRVSYPARPMPDRTLAKVHERTSLGLRDLSE